MCNCQYIEIGTPICKADKRLRNCNTSICCSFCPSLEFCERVCGVILFEQEYQIKDVIEKLKIINIEMPLNDILKSLLEELKKYDYPGFFVISANNDKIIPLIQEYFPYSGIILNAENEYLNKNNYDNLIVNYCKNNSINLNNQRKNPCFKSFYFIKVNSNGSLSPCENTEYEFGDLINQSLEEILLSKDFKNFKEKIISSNYNVNSICFHCNELENKYNKLIEKFYNY